MHVLVISRIVCCYCLLNRLSVAVVKKLQCVQKCLCSCHTDLIEIRPYVTPMPLELHWLSVKEHYFQDLHIYQHFSLPIGRHADYAVLISYFLNNPLPELKSVNDPFLPCNSKGMDPTTPYSVPRYDCALKMHLFIDYYFGNRRS